MENSNDQNDLPIDEQMTTRIEWDSSSYFQVLKQIAYILGTPKYKSFSTNLHDKIIEYTKEKIGNDDVLLDFEPLADLLNFIIKKDPTLYSEFQDVIKKIFVDCNQFTIPE